MEELPILFHDLPQIDERSVAIRFVRSVWIDLATSNARNPNRLRHAKPPPFQFSFAELFDEPVLNLTMEENLQIRYARVQITTQRITAVKLDDELVAMKAFHDCCIHEPPNVATAVPFDGPLVVGDPFCADASDHIGTGKLTFGDLFQQIHPHLIRRLFHFFAESHWGLNLQVSTSLPTDDWSFVPFLCLLDADETPIDLFYFLSPAGVNQDTPG